jgi:O-antigen/teichoic acid export membrane protein
MPDYRRKAINGMKWTTLSRTTNVVFYFIRIGIMARLLSPQDFGLFAIATVISASAQIFADIGISAALVYHQDLSREELSSLYWLNIATATAVMVVFYFIISPTAHLLGEPRLRNILLLMVPLFLITAAGQQFRFLLQKNLRFKVLCAVEISGVLANTLIGVSLALFGTGVASLVWGMIADAMVRTTLLVYIGFPTWRPRLHFRLSDIRRFWAFGFFQVGEKTLNYFARQVDKIMIGKILGARLLGYYNVAYSLVLNPLQMINPIINQVAFPVFSKIQHDDALLRKGYLEIISVIAFILMPVYAGLIAVGDPLILVLLGDEWRSSIPLFRLFAFLGAFYSLGNPIGNLLLAKGRADIGFYLNCCVFLLFVSAVWWGIHIGILATAAALIFVQVTILFPLGFFVRWKLIRMKPLEFLNCFYPFLASATIMSLAVYTIRCQVQWSNPLIDLSISVLIGTLVYLSIICIWKKEFLRFVLGLAFRAWQPHSRIVGRGFESGCSQKVNEIKRDFTRCR